MSGYGCHVNLYLLVINILMSIARNIYIYIPCNTYIILNQFFFSPVLKIPFIPVFKICLPNFYVLRASTHCVITLNCHANRLEM